MNNLLFLLTAAVLPLVLILNGKRWLGDQTHPAAIFILAWMVCALTLSGADPLPVSAGILALAWVALCYPLAAALRRSRGNRAEPSPAADEQKPAE